MSPSPSTSVVIPVLNGARTIGDTLLGLTRQTPPACATEIIVVDNGSTDGTPEIVAGYPVTLLREPKPGPSAARNRGLRAATGEVVAYLDADTLPTRRWLGAMAAAFAEPTVTLAAGRILAFRPETLAERYYARCILDRAEANATAEGFPFAASANMAIRRSAALAVGGWNEAYRVSQDVEFSHRVRTQLHTEVVYVPEAIVFLKNHATMDGLTRQAFKYGQGRARLWTDYREVAHWGPMRAARVGAGLILCAVWPYIVRLRTLIGQATSEDVALAYSHRAWTWAYWRGFRSMMRHGDWR